MEMQMPPRRRRWRRWEGSSMADVLNTDMGYTVEIVKQAPDGSIAADEVFPMGTCSRCSSDVVLGWLHCPGCGEPLAEVDSP